jgi:hypothetical protein
LACDAKIAHDSQDILVRFEKIGRVDDRNKRVERPDPDGFHDGAKEHHDDNQRAHAHLARRKNREHFQYG